MSTGPGRYWANPAFEALGDRAAGDVSMIMDCGLVSVMRGDRVVPVFDERGEGWVFASEDERFAVEARPISDDELADEAEIRAHLYKRGEWFSRTCRVYYDNQARPTVLGPRNGKQQYHPTSIDPDF